MISTKELILPDNSMKLDQEEMSNVEGGVQVLAEGPYYWKFKFSGAETNQIITAYKNGSSGFIAYLLDEWLKVGALSSFTIGLLESYNKNNSGVSVVYSINQYNGQLVGPSFTDNY